MAVSDVHRFLSSKTPDSIDKRIWVIGGQTLDLFFYNYFYGCKGIVENLKLWAIENDIDLIVQIDKTGEIKLTSPLGEDEAKRLFELSQTRRRPKYGNAFNESVAINNSQNSNNGQEEETAREAQEAAGGIPQSIQNKFAKITNLLTKSKVKNLIIFEDLEFFYRNLMTNEQTAVLANNLLHTIKTSWQSISYNSLLFFICTDMDGYNFIKRDGDGNSLSGVFPEKISRGVEYINISGPSEKEIDAAIIRLSNKHNFKLTGKEAICKQLMALGDLRVALRTLTGIINSGKDIISINDILRLPPINEQEVERIKNELFSLIGLQKVKDLMVKVEAISRDIRRKLDNGEAVLPDNTLHMVFTGNPGTGKTTAARIFAEFFHAVGILPTNKVIETSSREINSEFKNEAQKNMSEKLEESIGGVLFIDEAHRFAEGDSEDLKSAIKDLVKFAEDHRREMVIILAGYGDKMNDLFKLDEGLNRRFPTSQRVLFEDYSMDELYSIFKYEGKKNNYLLADNLEKRIKAILNTRKRVPNFGNAGSVRSLLQEILMEHSNSNRRESNIISKEDLPPLVKKDEKKLNKAIKELDKLIGMDSVKNKIQELIYSIEYDLMREESEFNTGNISLIPRNMLFVGPPGTGKTTAGEIVKDILLGLGCISEDKYICAGKDDLVAKYEGQTESLVAKLIDDYRGGVIFIDEAYSLVNGGNKGFGKEALDILLKKVLEPQNLGTVFILAGYKNEIDEMLAINPGLRRRFPVEIKFNNFSPKDCANLAAMELKSQGFIFEKEVLNKIKELADEEIIRRKEAFGNAGWVKDDLLPVILGRMKKRVRNMKISPNDLNFYKVCLCDVISEEEQLISESQNYREKSKVKIIDWVPKGKSKILRNYNQRKNLTIENSSEIIQKCAFQIITRDAEEENRVGSATGFFVTGDGIMATNAHVVREAADITVYCGQQKQPYKAYVTAFDEDIDLALIKVMEIDSSEYLTLGDSYRVSILSNLIVFGNAHVNPGEPGRLVNASVNRNYEQDARHFDVSGAIEPGFSGGPVFSMEQGNVVGIVTGGYGESAKLMIRCEQLRNMLRQLGYIFEV